MRLSALIVAHNEERNLRDCLASVAFADEVVVVLDRCTDQSQALAAAAGCRLLEGGWSRDSERRHAGLDICTGDWILEIDADERVPPALAAEIRQLIAQSDADYHAVPFLNHIGSRPVRHGWGGTIGIRSKDCLFRAGAKHWGAQMPHPRVSFRGRRGPALSGAIHHFYVADVAGLIDRLNRYSTTNAQDIRQNGSAGGLLRYIVRMFGRWWKCFVLHKGYKEGGVGFVIAACAGLYPLLSYVKARHDPAGPASAPVLRSPEEARNDGA